jgi:hypothetical protein
MIRVVFFTSVVVCLMAFMMKPYGKTANNRPVIIFYQPPVPADSLQDFLRVCFAMNKWVVLDTSERKALLSEHFQKFFKEQTDFRNENSRFMNEAEKEEWTKRFMQHPYNHLNVRIFSSKTSRVPETDSIRWQIRIPRMDTSQYRLFIPAPERKEIYASLKEFADTVLASGLLR